MYKPRKLIKHRKTGGMAMKLIGKLKEDVEKAETREEAKKVIKEAGMELTDEELGQVDGGKRSKTKTTGFR